MSGFSLFRRGKKETADKEPLRTGGGSATGKKKTSRPSDTDDPILPEKKRARRRLVGAITITLAAIIVLPMVFDSEPQTVSQDLLIDIPSRDRPSQTVSREPARRKAAEAPPAAAAEKPAAETAAAPQDKKEAAPSVTAESKPKDAAREKPAADAAANAKTEKTEAKPAPAKTEGKTAAAAKEDDPIGKLIAQNTAEKPAAGKEGKFVIQVAAVSSQDKVKELQDKLTKAGLTSYTQKVTLKEGGERIRVRIGPLPDRKELNNTCAKLSQLKLPCTLVN